MHRESCNSLLRLCLSTSYASIIGTKQLIVPIPRIDTTLMGYWIAVQVRNMMMSVMCKSNLRMRENILRRVLMMTCVVFLRDNLRSTSTIALLVSGRGRVYGLGDAFQKFW